MSSTCTVTTDDEQTWDEVDGVYVEGDPIEVYDGPCRLRWSPAPQDADAGEAMWAADRSGTLSLPIASTPLPDGATVVITGNPNDPDMIGLELTILTTHFQTDSTARRYPVQTVTRDAAVDSYAEWGDESS
jgi:hypothetical protein